MRLLPLLLLSLAVSLAACQPELKGECSQDSECPTGTRCAEGLCLADLSEGPDGGGKPDGGDPNACRPECMPGSRCEKGSCVADEGEIAITSPADGTAFGPGQLTVHVNARLAEGVSVVEVALHQGTTRLETQQTAQLVGGLYSVRFDLTKSAITSGAYTLKASVASATRTLHADPVQIAVDKTGPEITFLPPQDASGNLITGPYLRSDPITVRVSVTDEPGKLSNAPPTLELPGVTQRLVAVADGAPGRFRFEFSGRLPTFAFVEALLQMKVRATDGFGNESSKTDTVPMTRIKWRWTHGANVTAAPALREGHLYVGTADRSVYALRRADGSEAWDFNAGDKVIGHITVGSSAVYAVLKEGRVVALDPAEVPGAQRLKFRCPSGNNMPQNFNQSATGAALGTTLVSRNSPAEEETLFTMSTDGKLRLLRENPFPSSAITSDVCYRAWSVGVQTGTSELTLLGEQSPQSVFFGDNNKNLQRWDLSRDAFGVYGAGQTWSYSIGDKVLAPPVFGQIGSTFGLLGLRQDGGLRALTPDKIEIYTTTPKPLTGTLRASPVHAGGFGYLVNQAGKVQKFQMSNGQPLWATPFDGAPRSLGAEGSPVIAQDGTVYVSTGSLLAALTPQKEVAWTYEPRPLGTAPVVADALTPALACDGTLYVALNEGTSQGAVVALITDSTSGLATDGWPKAFHDNRNTSNASHPLHQAGICQD